MSDLSKLAKIQEAVETADAALALAKSLLSEVTGLASSSHADSAVYAEKAATVSRTSTSTGRVIEGVFDGQNMVDKKGATYPVPANYASKSKLIPGDVLKLTVTDEGKFLYKQIGPVERKTVIGPLVYDDGHYKVLANGKAYNVLLASVTYFRASVGDEVTLIIPMREESDWAAIEAVLPKFDEGAGALSAAAEPAAKPAKKEKKSKKELDIEAELDI